MNDPHVEALYYSVNHGEHVDYTKAPPFEHDEQDFRIRLAGRRAEIAMKSHFPSLEDARAAVEPLLRAWSLDMALRYARDPSSLNTSAVSSSTASPPPAFIRWSPSQPLSR